MNKIKYYFCIIVGLVLSLSACIYEDCPANNGASETNLKILFFYDEENEIETIPADELDTAILYVFDSNNRLVNFCPISKPKLNFVYDNLLSLDPEKYVFVVWFNAQDPYLITPSIENLVIGTTLKNQGLFSLTIPANQMVSAGAGLPRSLHGREEATIDSIENLVRIPVRQNSNRINFTVKGLLPSTDIYRFAIEDDNGKYDFENDFAPCPRFSYVTDVQNSPTQDLKASLTVLQLAETRSPKLSIKNLTSGETLFPGSSYVTDNLIDIIGIRYPGNDFRKRHVYDVEIKIEYNDDPELGGVEIWITGWEPDSSKVKLTPW